MSVDRYEKVLVLIVTDKRFCFGVVYAESVFNYLGLIVLTNRKRCTAFIAVFAFFGRIILHVEGSAASGAESSAAHTLYDCFIGHFDIE